MSDALKTLILQIIEDLDSKGLIIECVEEQCAQQTGVPLLFTKVTTRTTSRWSIRREQSRGGWVRDLCISLLGSLLATALWWLVSRQ